MIRLGRFSSNVLSAVAGALVGALIVLGADGLTRGAPPPEVAPPTAPAERTKEPKIAPSDQLVLVWAVNGIPRSVTGAVREVRGVREVAEVAAGLDWIEWSRSPEGSPIDSPAAGRAIPVEVAAINPRSYARFVPAGDRATILAMAPGEAILARTARRLRRGGEGLRVGLRSGTVRVAGVVSDEAANGYEMLIAAPPPSSWARVERYLLVRTGRPRLEALQSTVRRALGPGVPFRLRVHGETPFLRHGDAVLPQMILKDVFGEFSAVPGPNGFLDVQPSWQRKSITSEQVPLLGRVTCHRALFPQLRGALSEIDSSGLGFLLDPSDFGGCFNARFINATPDARVSHHSWGIAIDINVSENAYGTKPDLDGRIVEIMEEWGFSWGGRWLVPDGMHFEWTRFP